MMMSPASLAPVSPLPPSTGAASAGATGTEDTSAGGFAQQLSDAVDDRAKGPARADKPLGGQPARGRAGLAARLAQGGADAPLDTSAQTAATTDPLAGSTETRAAAQPEDKPATDPLALLPGWTPPASPTPAMPEPDAPAQPAGSEDDMPSVPVEAADAAPARRPAAAAGARTNGQAALAEPTEARTSGKAADTRGADAAVPAGRAASEPAAGTTAARELPSTTMQALTGSAPALQSQHTASAAHARGTPPAFEAQLSAALGSPEFAPALGVQLSILAREGVQQARLHLHPAEMGPIAVQIALDGTQAQVHFEADVAATREALQNSLPELAQALRDGGFTLSGGGVSGGGSGQREGEARPAGASAAGRGDTADAGGPDLPGATPPPVSRPRGVVDLYA